MNALKKIDELNGKFGLGAKYRESVRWSKLGKNTRIELTLYNLCDPYRCHGEYLQRPNDETIPMYTQDDDWYMVRVYGNTMADAASKMLKKLNGHTFALGFCLHPFDSDIEEKLITFLNLDA